MADGDGNSALKWQMRSTVVTGAVRARTGAIFFMGGGPNCSSLWRLAQKSPRRVVVASSGLPRTFTSTLD
jgi:hypothetical protein